MVKKIQSGVVNTIERWREFGRLIINQLQLRDNWLNVKYKSNGSCRILKTKISDEFKALVFKIFDNGSIDYTIGKLLSDKERALFGNLLGCAGLNLQLEYDDKKMEEDINELRKRYNIIKGEILANNNNPKLLTDAIGIIHKLIKVGDVSESDGKEIIDELENEIKNI